MNLRKPWASSKRKIISKRKIMFLPISPIKNMIIYVKHLTWYIAGVQQMIAVVVMIRSTLLSLLLLSSKTRRLLKISASGIFPSRTLKRQAYFLFVSEQLLIDCRSHETGTTCQVFLGLICQILEVHPHTALSLLGWKTICFYQCKALWSSDLWKLSVHGDNNKEIKLPSNTTTWKTHMQGIWLVI